MAQSGNDRYAGLIFAGLGSLFTIIGIVFLLDAIAFDKVALPARGVVINVERTSSRDSETGRISYSYTPTFRYTARNGETHEAETHIASSEYNFRIGAEADVLYDPADPTEVRLSSFTSRYVLPLAFTFGGLLFVGIGIAIYSGLIKSQRSRTHYH